MTLATPDVGQVDTSKTDPAQFLEAQAKACVLDLRVDEALSGIVEHATENDLQATPWLMCYAAMQQRLVHANYLRALHWAQAASNEFQRVGDVNGQARALATAGIARYQLGQRVIALTELDACAAPTEPACAAALSLAVYLNRLGIDDLPAAIEAIQSGLAALEHEANPYRRAIWRVTLQRNLAPAYHYNGQLARARAAVADALQLIDAFPFDASTRVRTLYEAGLLEQRAGRFDVALEWLQRAQDLAEKAPYRDPFWRWIIVVRARVLRDTGRLDEADELYQIGGWGEGDDGPLWLWLLQGRHVEARHAAEARLTAAHAIGSPVEVADHEVFFALLDLEAGATPSIAKRLEAAAATYAELGFWYHHASVQFHIAAVAYEFGDKAASDQALATALAFGAAQGYHNFVWWHGERMRTLLQRALEYGIEADYSARLLRERDLLGTVSGERASTTNIQPGTKLLELRCFGRFEALLEGHAVPSDRWHGQPGGVVRMQRLLLYLTRHRSPQPITAIGRYVWPDRYEDIDVLANIHVTLSGLRRVVEPDLQPGATSRFILTTLGSYQLHPEIKVMIDLEQFEICLHVAQEAAEKGDAAAARAAYEHVEQIYRGPFVLSKPDPAEGEFYHTTVAQAIRWLAADDLAHGRTEQALARARRLVHEDRWDHEAWALVIQAYLAQGNRRAARRQYERYLRLYPEPDTAMKDLARMHKLIQ